MTDEFLTVTNYLGGQRHVGRKDLIEAIAATDKFVAEGGTYNWAKSATCPGGLLLNTIGIHGHHDPRGVEVSDFICWNFAGYSSEDDDVPWETDWKLTRGVLVERYNLGI